jgi:hypothetical protein
MAETDGAWWSEVEHLREGIERRRAEEAERKGFDRVAHGSSGRFARRQQELTTTERDRVDAELADLASPTPRSREGRRPGDASERTGRFDRRGEAPPLVLPRDDEPELEPAPPAPVSEPISPSQLLSLDVGWQEPAREEERGEFTELIIPGQGVPGRPTVQIRGHGAEARIDALLSDRARRRPPRTVSERLGPRPDRVALWALVLAVVLIITAVATADASTLTY